ncbi:hypothetical protein ACFY05_10800 [Microtetraspora fusca]|uniref:Uncharacterized protein n=1 Tax=Microtetraspora fusca TaxID=1997 RepID=A0ABW6V633_MICFU
MPKVCLWAVGLAMAAALTLSACQPRAEEQFHIINTTHETVTVRWKSNNRSFVTLNPGERAPFGFSDKICDGEEVGILVATSETGETYTYGPRICKGESWRIGE